MTHEYAWTNESYQMAIASANAASDRAAQLETEREQLMLQNRVYGDLSIEAAKKIDELRSERDEARAELQRYQAEREQLLARVEELVAELRECMNQNTLTAIADEVKL